MKLAPYPDYKDSGVLWLGKIPVHWNERKTKYLFGERTQKGYPEEPLLAATQTKGVVPKTMYDTRTVTAQKDLHILKLVEVGDFVISLRSFQGGIEYAYFRGIISPAYTVMITGNDIGSGYFKHLAKSRPFLGLLKTCVTGIREGQNVDYERLKNSILPLPTSEEQMQIACFLDWKNAQINKFIRNKRRLRSLLWEKIETMVFGTVIGSKATESVDWKDLFPSHWGSEKAKRIFEERNINNACDKELLAVTQDRGVLPKSMCAQKYVSPGGRLEALKLVQQTDYVISLRSFQGGIEYSAYEGIVSPAYTVIRLRRKFRSPEYRIYFRVLFKTVNFIKLLNTAISGIRDGKNISYVDFADLEIPVPPLNELDDLLQAFDDYQSFVRISEREIELMREYQTRLISDVVTGQADVRGIEVPEVAEEELLALEDDTAESDDVADDEGDMDEVD